jgi:glycosyltransferase involved in cell wall biosynthesis
MRAFAALKRDLAESKMLVVGEGVDSARLRALSTKLGILDCLEFTGKVSTSDLVHIYRRAWVHVQPSSAEGWGYTVLEAAATGTPTVAVAGTALDESVGPDCRKYLAHSADPDRLAESLELCIMDMRDEPDMIAKRMIAYASQFDWNLTAKSFEALLRTTLTGDPFAKGSTQSFSRALAESQ